MLKLLKKIIADNEALELDDNDIKELYNQGLTNDVDHDFQAALERVKHKSLIYSLKRG
jgi:hypothetical protein